MNSVQKSLGVTGILLLAAAVPARAQVTELLSPLPSTFSIPSSGGWSVTLQSCAVTNVNCGAEEVVASVSGSTLSLAFESDSGANLLYNPTTGLQQDLTINLTVTAPSGQEIYLATETLVGTALPSGAGVNVSAGETLTGPAEGELNTSLTTSLFASQVFAPVAPAVTASTDILNGYGHATTSVHSVTLTFTTAPEPVSSALLAVGVAGIGLVRRKNRLKQ